MQIRILLVLLGLIFSQAFAQSNANQNDEVNTPKQEYKIIYRMRLGGYMHLSEDFKGGFFYSELCTGAQGRWVEVLRMFLDQVGNVSIVRIPENFLAYGYLKSGAECAELRRSLEKINGDPATVEFRNFQNAQRPLLWTSFQDAEHQIVVNGRVFSLYRTGTLNPIN